MTATEFNIDGVTFSKHLFWDVNPADVDTERNEAFLTQRVLEYGRISDWHLISKLYGLDRIAATAKKFRSLEPRALSFIATITSTSKEKFRCYTTKQSNRRHWIY